MKTQTTYSEIESVLNDNGYKTAIHKYIFYPPLREEILRLAVWEHGILLEKTMSNIRFILSDFDVKIDVMPNAEEIWITLK